MKRKIYIYLSLVVLLSTTFFNSALAIAEVVEQDKSELEAQEAISASEAVETSDTSPCTSQSDTTVESSGAELEQSKKSVTETIQSAAELEDSIQPRAPNNSSEIEVNPFADGGLNLNAQGVQLFNGISITDTEGNPFDENNQPFYKDNIQIHFTWALSNVIDINAGDYYTYQLPTYFKVHNEVSQMLTGENGIELGEFHLATNGELKIVFNENAKNLSERKGTIRLITELNVETTSESIVIETGIYDQENKEIEITLPIFQIDITKNGKLSSNNTIVWEIIFNTGSAKLEKVILTDELPEGLDYSYSHAYIFDGESWVQKDDLYEYNGPSNTYTFTQTINQPIKIEIHSDIKDLSVNSFTNIAKITGATFLEKEAEATVSYQEETNYKRFAGYDPQTGQASWEVSLTISAENMTVTDKTFFGTLSENALHYLVEDSVEVKNKNDGTNVSSWKIKEENKIEKDGKLVQFQLAFDHPGQYILRYKTQLFDPVLKDTKIDNYLIAEGVTYTGSGNATATSKIGVTKTSVAKSYQEQTIQWQIEVNQQHNQVDNLVIIDQYQEISGANRSALELMEETIVVTATSQSGETSQLAATDFELTKLSEIAGEPIGEHETGFQIKLKGNYATTSDKITVAFTTKFDVTKQVDLGSSATRFSNSVLVEYELGDQIYSEAAQKDEWLDQSFVTNALKAGVFIPKGGNIENFLKTGIDQNLENVFGEEVAQSDQIIWMGLFNTLKSKLSTGTIIKDSLQEGQIFKEVTVYSVEVSGIENQVASLQNKLSENEDYQLEYNSSTKEVSIKLLKDTSATIAVFIAVEASTDTFRYKNMISLENNTLNLKAEAQVDKSAKDDWLSKSGVQNTSNNRLIDWEVLINQDSHTINDAVVEDTINYNQQNFLYDEEGNVLVDVYKAVKNGNQWQKGAKVTFSNENNPKVTTNGTEGTVTLSIAFEEVINSPYFIVYQTKLDPGIQNNETISNDARLSGGLTEIHQVTKEVIVKSTNGSGTSTGTNGSLTIKKYDAEEDENSGIDKDAIFRLSRQNADGNYEIIFPKIIVKNNKIIQGESEAERLSGLRYGTYKIQEIEAPDGYERDAQEYTFTISSQRIDYIFSLANKKATNEVELELTASKVLEGRTLLDGEFTFELVDDTGKVIQTQPNSHDGSIYFEALSYDKAGEYHYTLREKAGTDETIEYDNTTYPVMVTVADKSGQLEATASMEGNGVFTNVYTPKAGSVVISAEKILEGRTLEAGEFTFELVDNTGKVIQSQPNSHDGSIYFEALSYDKAGEYHYTIREKAGTDETIEYDNTTYPVMVTVADKSGQLEATASLEGNGVFTNVYTPKAGSVVISAEKILEGRTLETGEFTFELVDDTGKVIQSQTNSHDGSVYFEALSYDKAGEYHYTLREKAGTDETIEYDNTTYPVMVTVADKSGQLEATASMEGNGVFTNVYTPKAGSVVISAEKILEGRTLEASEFTFELVDDTGKVIQSQTNSHDGSVYFEALSYDKAGEYHYTLREKEGEDTTIKYDSTTYPVTVTVKDVNGQLEATASMEGNGVFTNVYTPKAGSVVISAEKNLEGRTLEAGEFTFELVDDTGKVIQSQPNSHDGSVYFEALSYDKAGEYHYTLREKVGEDATIEYDSTTYPVTVTVKDVDGQLEATASLEGNGVFTNVYTPKAGSVVISAEKILEGRTLEAGEFTFELVDNAGKVIQSQSNSHEGSIYFEALSYDKAGEYHYTLREKVGEDKTIKYDSTTYPVTVTVRDVDGQLKATINMEGNGVFTNVYIPKAGSVVISAEKVLTGRTLEVGEFTFELVDETGNVIQSQPNSHDGSVYFEALSYDKAGEYHYTLREKAGEDATIEYDSTTYPVTVTVKDVDGQLKATTSMEGNGVFTNIYTPKAGSVVISAEKVLTGRTLEVGEFTFELVDETGNVIQSQPNSHDGSVYFEALSYDKAGEYHYTLREKAGEDATIEYDSTTYPVTVTVKDVDGQLKATTSMEGNGVFTNIYTPKAGSVVISAEKVLEGRTLEANEFTFELVDDTGKVIQSQPNSHDGSIYFEALSYDKAGEYHYTLREKAGEDKTIEYDNTTYPVTVTVTEVRGQLEAKVNDNKQAVFVNKFKLVSDEDTEDRGKEKPQVEEDPTEKEPKDEPTSDGKNKLPQTGELNQISWMVAGGLFVSIVGVISYYRRQSSKTK